MIGMGQNVLAHFKIGGPSIDDGAGNITADNREATIWGVEAFGAPDGRDCLSRSPPVESPVDRGAGSGQEQSFA